MIRLLHLSDLHINAGFSNKSAYIREQLKEGLWRSFQSAIQYVFDEGIEGVLLVGDTFDHPEISYTIERQFTQEIWRLLDSEKHVFYVSGNHDPKFSTVFLDEFRKSTYFHLFDEDDIVRKTIHFEDGQVLEVVGFGHKANMMQRDLVAQFPAKSNHHMWLGLAHASVLNARHVGEKVSYMDTTLHNIQKLSYDYFALGHIHIQQKLAEGVAYCGNLQGLNYKEVGEKGGLVVELDSKSTRVIPVAFNHIQWEAMDYEFEADVEKLADFEHVLEKEILETLGDIDHDVHKVILRVNLYGNTGLYSDLKSSKTLEELEEILTKKTGLLAVDLKDIGLQPQVNVDMLKAEKTVLADMIQLTEDLDINAALLDRLLSLPIYQEPMTREAKIEYLKTMLGEVKPELIHRMLKVTHEH